MRDTEVPESNRLTGLHAMLHRLLQNPNDSRICHELQTDLLDAILEAEAEVRLTKAKLSNANPGPDLTPLPIAYNDAMLAFRAAELQLGLLRSIGDGMAFIYLDPSDIKHLASKQHAGFMSGKSGLSLEVDTLKYLLEHGHIAILNDLTLCLRHADITVIQPPGFQLIEVKSGRRVHRRVERQLRAAARVTRFTHGDSSRSPYDDPRPVFIAGSSAGFTEWARCSWHAEASILLREAEKSGFAFKEVERGLWYVFAQDPVRDFVTVLSACHEKPIMLCPNPNPSEAVGFCPLSLLFDDARLWLLRAHSAFFFAALIEPSALQELFRPFELRVIVAHESTKALHLYSTNARCQGEPAEIALRFFSRLGYEFMKLSWFATRLGAITRAMFDRTT
jgi:hypothetical protein